MTQLPALAPRSVRFAAVLVDLMIAVPLLVLWLISAMSAIGFSIGALAKHQQHSLATQAGSALAGGVAWVVLIATSIALALLALYQMASLAADGQTIGKRVFGIRIVDLEGKPAGLIRALVLRALLFSFLLSFAMSFMSAVIPLSGLLIWFLAYVPVLGEERRGLHDYFAGTQVRWVRVVEVKTGRIVGALGGVALMGAAAFALINKEAPFVQPPVPAPAPVVAAVAPVPARVVAPVIARVIAPVVAEAPQPGASEKKIYQFTDAQGVLHVTDDESKVPPEFR
jgi:uncharacterized RDD family membrane protein YckC